MTDTTSPKGSDCGSVWHEPYLCHKCKRVDDFNDELKRLRAKLDALVNAAEIYIRTPLNIDLARDLVTAITEAREGT
jgi:hypothetical protein